MDLFVNYLINLFGRDIYLALFFNIFFYTLGINLIAAIYWKRLGSTVLFNYQVFNGTKAIIYSIILLMLLFVFYLFLFINNSETPEIFNLYIVIISLIILISLYKFASSLLKFVAKKFPNL